MQSELVYAHSCQELFLRLVPFIYVLMFLLSFPQVEILAGKDKGKQGKVIQVFRHRNWVILEGLNTVRKSNYSPLNSLCEILCPTSFSSSLGK